MRTYRNSFACASFASKRVTRNRVNVCTGIQVLQISARLPATYGNSLQLAGPQLCTCCTQHLRQPSYHNRSVFRSGKCLTPTVNCTETKHDTAHCGKSGAKSALPSSDSHLTAVTVLQAHLLQDCSSFLHREPSTTVHSRAYNP